MRLWPSIEGCHRKEWNTISLFWMPWILYNKRALYPLIQTCGRKMLSCSILFFFAFSSLWTGALVETRREQAKRVVHNGKKDTTTSPLSWIAVRDPVENASFMPRVLATACIHSVILPLLHSWTSFLNIVTFPCCVLGTFSIWSELLAFVHSFANR
ncbi:hypothetical protein M9H77_19074 [Catharanthus roseus]|uniref:Uncharacterized protein n=1 Tax=Catharanthus roseus TaxID=4058 RepID=A0ACC0B9A7_CATRO|nr:hypothetical protein M9H77_19074 [Catharanthus roseus]